MKILLAGGGSGGPVAPMLAVARQIKKTHPKAAFLLVGTKQGPEKNMAEAAGIEFYSIPSGKLRRYFSLWNFTTPFVVLAGFFVSLRLLRQYRPDCVFGAGSFVQVPVAWAAWLLRIPVLLHQQDLVPSLANKLCEVAAKKITVTFKQSQKHFSSGLGLFYKKNHDEKVVVTGNPFRSDLEGVSREEGLHRLKLKKDLPVLLVLGGGTGAQFLNNLVAESLPRLTRTVQVIHSTGKGKYAAQNFENYFASEFISDMGAAYAAADIVVSRAGLSTITELSNLGKLSIIVPMPDSHQEINAWLMSQRKAAIVAPQDRLNPELLVELVRKLLFEHKLQEELKINIAKLMPKDADKKIAEEIVKLAIV